jgi:hypothetical protein
MKASAGRKKPAEAFKLPASLTQGPEPGVSGGYWSVKMSNSISDKYVVEKLPKDKIV